MSSQHPTSSLNVYDHCPLRLDSSTAKPPLFDPFWPPFLVACPIWRSSEEVENLLWHPQQTN
jgi:hypothetical protein